MPIPIAAKAGIIAVTVAVAAAIALYESPELRQFADDLRRRIAVALHSLGDGINPPTREGEDGNPEPMFNRPEDAEGFLQSRRGAGAEPGVDADEETRRRQREELMYWNALHIAKQEKAKMLATLNKQEDAPSSESSKTAATRGSGVSSPVSFDDFLHQDESAERGTFVFNTGAQYHNNEEGLVRRRGAGVDGVRGLNASIYANPFADEHQIDAQEVAGQQEPDYMTPDQDEIFSDIYSASTRHPDDKVTSQQGLKEDITDASSRTMSSSSPVLVDDVPSRATQIELPPTLERELADDEFMTAGQDREQGQDQDQSRAEAYASIQAWAQNSSHPDFYSPLPMSPAPPASEPELVDGDGDLTPMDSMSLAGSGIDVANDARSSINGETGRFYDVLSESDGRATPSSWSEVGSAVSESEPPMHPPAHA